MVGYVRVSTEDQNLGPEAQRASLERWCQAHAAELVAVHADHGVSGGAEIDARPGLLAALDTLRSDDTGVLLVAKRDRLARDPIVAVMVERLAERNGATVCTADGTANGRESPDVLTRRIIDAFAEYERRIVKAMRNSRSGSTKVQTWVLPES